MTAEGSAVSHHVFEHGDISRQYIFVNGSSKALVMVLHGFSETPTIALKRLKPLRELGFSLLAPRGTGEEASWNAGYCCGKAVHDKVDDVGYLSLLIKFVLKEWFSDSIRVYVMYVDWFV